MCCTQNGGLFGSALTLIRKAIFRATGIFLENLTSSFLSSCLNKLSIFFRNTDISEAWQFICRCTSLGSIIALLFDFGQDGDPFNNKIVIW
jgi:hypothetical protein